MVRVAVGLGSNMGDRLAYLQAAIGQLWSVSTVLKVSPVYETVPMYVSDQPSFLNAAVEIETSLGPLELLAALKRIEREVGRMPSTRYGPREIDLDLLVYGSLVLDSKRPGYTLSVPHPRTPERLFVLQPLNDLDPDWRLPGLGTVRELMARAPGDPGDVRRFDHAALSIHRDR